MNVLLYTPCSGSIVQLFGISYLYTTHTHTHSSNQLSAQSQLMGERYRRFSVPVRHEIS